MKESKNKSFVMTDDELKQLKKAIKYVEKLNLFGSFKSEQKTSQKQNRKIA